MRGVKMPRIKLMKIAHEIQHKFGVETRTGRNCIYYKPCRFLGAGDKRKDKIEHVEDLTMAIVDHLRDNKIVNECFCRITGEEVKINFF